MLSLVSHSTNYFLLLLEEKKKNKIFKEMFPIITNDVDLQSDIKDVGLVIPIETVAFRVVEDARVGILGITNVKGSIRSEMCDGGQSLAFSTPSDMDEGGKQEEKIIFEKNFPSRQCPSLLPIYVYDGGISFTDCAARTYLKM